MVDAILLERVINDIRSNVRELEKAEDITWEAYQNEVRVRRYVERTLHVLIEACIDAAQHIISDEGYREPLSFRDAFIVLAEENIVSRELLLRLEKMAAFRNLIVHYYERVDDQVVFDVFKQHTKDFLDFAESIAAFLTKFPNPHE